MKKYLFIVLAAVISLFSSCAEDDAAIGLSGLKVSQSYVALPVEGGSTDITIESKSEWIITGNDKADWLTISTTQGNWDIVDATGKVYVYGTLDAKGNTKNFASLGLEEGDEVTIQGPKTTYGTTVELVDVTVLKINKSLIKVDSVYNDVLPVEGGIFTQARLNSHSRAPSLKLLLLNSLPPRLVLHNTALVV